MFIANHFFQATADASASVACADVSASSSSSPLLVLFMLDELAKSGCEDEILSLMGSILDPPLTLNDGRRFTVLVTVSSLSRTRMLSLCSKLSRSFRKVTLPVSLPSARDALMSMLELKPHQGVLIDVLVRDVGGHGRMLEAISLVLARGSEIRTRLDAATDQSPLTFLRDAHAELLSHPLSSAFFQHLSGSVFLVDAVCNALLGRAVSRYQPIWPHPQTVSAEISQWTYDGLQALGIVIGDASDSDVEIIPIMLPLQLVKWASSILISRAYSSVHSQFDVFLNSVLSIFSAENLYDLATFERFHLRTLIHSSNKYFFY